MQRRSVLKFLGASGFGLLAERLAGRGGRVGRTAIGSIQSSRVSAQGRKGRQLGGERRRDFRLLAEPAGTRCFMAR